MQMLPCRAPLGGCKPERASDRCCVVQRTGVHRNADWDAPCADSRALRLRHPLHPQDGVQPGLCAGHERPWQAQWRHAVAECQDFVAVSEPGDLYSNHEILEAPSVLDGTILMTACRS